MGCSNLTTVKAEPPVPKKERDHNLILKDDAIGSNQVDFVDTKKESDMMKTESEMMVKQEH